MDLVADRTLLDSLYAEVGALRQRLLDAEHRRSEDIAGIHPAHRASARNLVHYLELRRTDLRDLQARLGGLGLSSLGRCESAVLASVEAVLDVLAVLVDAESPISRSPVTHDEGRALLVQAADRLLGVAPEGRSTRIMVTLPSGAADDATLVADLAAHGMDVVRINCAHDDVDAWRRMLDHVDAARRSSSAPLPVAIDLAGPKLRTGPIRTAPGVMKIGPTRDRLGSLVAPAHVHLVHVEHVDDDARFVVPVTDRGWLRRRVVGERLQLVDARGRKRIWTIDTVDPDEPSATAIVERTSYVTAGTELCAGLDDDALVDALPEVEQFLRVHLGDVVELVPSLEPVDPTDAGPHRIGCTLPEAFDHVRTGDRVFFDDGRIGGVVGRVSPEGVAVELTMVAPGGAKLRSAKGINLPDTELTIDALTASDLEHLDVVGASVDVVQLSFVQRPTDVHRLQLELAGRGVDPGVVLKIETAAAFEQLPELLLAAMRSERIGVMIARGDLAVEVGFERLAEVQEEIMWVCEAAHVPVVWATQVLDTMARTGVASRAEVTDAAMSVRAECVMLNKGAHIVDALQTLDSILRRMQHHQHKKRSLLRRLGAWDHVPG